MAFFEKLNDIAKNIGDKTSDIVETTKLSAKIGNERTAIAESMKKLGEYYYDRHKEGASLDDDVAGLLSDIDARHHNIAEMQAQIDSIKAGNAAKPEPDAEPAAEHNNEEIPIREMRYCTDCAAGIPMGAKFCGKCGKPVS